MAELKTYSISDYKSYLGSGLRKNMYKIDMVFPTVIPNIEAEKVFSIMCDTGKLPGERAVAPISVGYEGDFVSIAGDKAAPEALDFKFKNSQENIFLRKQFRLWSQLLQTYRTGVKSVPTLYKTDTFFVSILNQSKQVVEKVQLIGAYIVSVSAIEVGMDNGEITDTTINIMMDDYKLIV